MGEGKVSKAPGILELGPLPSSGKAGRVMTTFPSSDSMFLFIPPGVWSCWLSEPDEHEAAVFGGCGGVLAGAPSPSQQGEGGEQAAPCCSSAGPAGLSRR